MTRPTAIAASNPITFDQPILSPRRARQVFGATATPFLVDPAAVKEQLAPVGTPSTFEAASTPAETGTRFVFRGIARRPVFVACVAAMVAMTAIGLFLGLMLGEMAG